MPIRDFNCRKYNVEAPAHPWKLIMGQWRGWIDRQDATLSLVLI